MRISNQLLRSQSRCPLHAAEYLNLNGANIEVIERLQACGKLQHLNLHDNAIRCVENLQGCSNLWHVDLSNNQIQCLDGLSRFVALGSLNLSNNRLSWCELAKLRHMHILRLSLQGNPALHKDPYYRIHVIDILPNVWMLDGRIITAAERVQVQQFFHDLSATQHPVRRKVSKECFVPTSLKNIRVNGIFGDKAVHLMAKFPVKEPQNADTDKRRLKYLAHTIQGDFQLQKNCTGRQFQIMESNPNFLEDLLSLQSRDPERCNMLLLLLVASLEFAIPAALMQETLETSQLIMLGNLRSMDVFLLPRERRTEVVSLLLSAVKVDRDAGKDGGLYDKLYLCVYYAVSELCKMAATTQRDDLADLKNTSQQLYRESKCLIASEVVQLMCVVPAFFNYITKDVGVNNLVNTAASDQQIITKVKKLFKKLNKEQAEVTRMCEQVSDLLLRMLQKHTDNVANSPCCQEDSFILKEEQWNNGSAQTHKAIPQRPKSTPIYTAEYHSSGRTSPEKMPFKLKIGKPPQNKWRLEASLGDAVLMGPQTVGRIISLPDKDIALVQMDVIPAESGAMVSNRKNAEEHYTYLDLKQLKWDQDGYWRPKGTIGDRLTLTLEDDLVAPSSQGKQRPKSAYPDLNQPLSPSSSRGQRSQEEEPPDEEPTPQVTKKPRAVSARLKERLNLKLSLDKLHSAPPGSPMSPSFLAEKVLAPREDNEMKSVTGTISEQSHNIPSHLRSDDKEREDEEDRGDEASAAGGSGRSSRRSSLASQDEPELAGLREPPTRPGTAVTRQPSTASRPGTASRQQGSRPGTAIRVPGQLSPTKTQIGESWMEPPPSRVGSREGVARAQHVTIATTPPGSRGRVLPSAGHGQSPHSTLRLSLPSPSNEARETVHTKSVTPTRGSALDSSRPQSSRGTPGSRQALSVSVGDQWLGGGRDLYGESRRLRPQSSHTPGWRQGLPVSMATRPKSAAAARSLKRSNTPTMQTPSSLAYDSSHGNDLYQSTPHRPLPWEGHPPSPVPHSAGFRRLGTTPTPFSSRPSTPVSQCDSDFRWS